MKKIIFIILLSLTSIIHAQIANGSKKFLGNITTGGNIKSDFSQYWNQITGENECKWATVEGTRGSMNWSGCDRVYNYAKENNIPTKFHTLVWGSQYPSWMDGLSQSEQLAEITEWMDLAKEKYPDLQMIDVVNEAIPSHAPAPFKDALGGDGQSGYDWIITSFKMARERWPNAILIYNDYNVLSWNTDDFINLMTAIKPSGYVDAMGFQSHGLEDRSAAQLKTTMEKIHNAIGLPIYISEYDLSIQDDNQQKQVLSEQFPVFWEADYVAGITMWGYIYGSTWIDYSGLINNNSERPALQWLKSYVADNLDVPVPPIVDPTDTIVVEPYAPYNDTPHQIPGLIQAQEYDFGGEGVSYHEANSNGNEGGATFRDDQVDIEISEDVSGEYNIGYSLQSEWLNYTINASSNDNYEIEFRIATEGTGKSIHLEIDDNNIGEIEIPETGGWQSWQTITMSNISISTGKHILKVVFDSDYINLNWMNFKSSTTTGTYSITEPSTQDTSIQLSSNYDFLLEHSGQFNYEIFNCNGIKVDMGKAENQIRVGSQLSSGIYFIHLSSYNGNNIVRKILKN